MSLNGVFVLANSKVILYSNETVLDSVVCSLIASAHDMELTLVTARDFERLVELVEVIRPDAILIVHSILSRHHNLLNRLLDSQHLSRVITLDQNHNVLHVYTRHEIAIMQSSDLLQVIRSKRISYSINLRRSKKN